MCSVVSHCQCWKGGEELVVRLVLTDHHSISVATAVFQQIDIEEYIQPQSPPSIRIYGVTQEGYSVLVHVRGFLPYFYVHAPRGFRQDTCAALRTQLNVRILYFFSPAGRYPPISFLRFGLY